MREKYEISTRARTGGYDWSLYAPDGEEVASDFELGPEKNARAAAERAQSDHYMETRRAKLNDKPKRPRDANQLAKFIVDMAAGDDPVHEPDTSGQRKGGKKGSKKRALELTPEQRSEISSVAAAARWKKSDD